MHVCGCGCVSVCVCECVCVCVDVFMYVCDMSHSLGGKTNAELTDLHLRSACRLLAKTKHLVSTACIVE